MPEPLVPSVVVNICHNCIPEAAALPRQWREGTALVVVRELPCTGKLDLQYLLHAIEGVSGGVCVVACPVGECRLAQGNQRARIRVETLRKLLIEIGLESERAELLHCERGQSAEGVERAVHEAVGRILGLGPNALLSSEASTPKRGTLRGDGSSPPHREVSVHSRNPSTTDAGLE
jgi:coenzyme F420-reducing hydrogenase delta subunit